VLRRPESISLSELLFEIEKLNQDPSIDGILLQLPLPSHLSASLLMEAISPAKDVDGFHPLNMGKLLLGDETGIRPCTPLGIQYLLEKENVFIEGKHVVIVGRSNIVGKPLAALLVQKKKHCNATVTLCHSHSEKIDLLTRSADILITAMGKPHFLKGEMVKLGAVVIDVGIQKIDGKIVGDVEPVSVSKVASKMTPVPGGVGPMTIAMLLKNTLESFKRRKKLHENL
jgi:methylenetetrahydrofolate dehydrogenase (NADP+)/methenyltetrahydrofolate cyclohydrolase